MTEQPSGATPISIPQLVQAVGELYLQNWSLRRALEELQRVHTAPDLPIQASDGLEAFQQVNGQA